MKQKLVTRSMQATDYSLSTDFSNVGYGRAIPLIGLYEPVSATCVSEMILGNKCQSAAPSAQGQIDKKEKLRETG